ncbi:hypothetical protein FLA105534_00264 [Flavobacterium bizetiae]|uniref:DUF4238 domain-containing protein n=1 Tax=Flavobacterium bizetiae TaxID=2704140 RepID=A0A6J4G7H9_9FLAO|nr:DUF4238 domain-containing protein [Flavobacterium bizetiae]CAA9194674.1 hypothetical protein FLA105534_00264 [Flavobacterium bizetiae]CAD5343603.1 hypothetical protein FLA105535_03603 [Flavobacterium bizetiae]CAD5347796.1 hypothetical protein FLA105534_01755 [Flavobacterium bizetiae]
MNNISWRHHYLPIFYLKGFTKQSGFLKIFNVQEKRFLKNGKEFSPESFFFEKNANTVIFGDKKNDYIESSYSDFDNEMATLIKRITNSDYTTNYNVTEEEMPRINHFVSLMYWRLPHRTNDLKEILQNTDLGSLGLKIVNKSGERQKVTEEEFKNNPEFMKGFKYYNSLMDSIRGVNCTTPYSIVQNHENFPFLCSDNPVVFQSENPKVYQDDYLFPLSGNRLFIKANRTSDFPPYLRMLVDAVVYKQAQKYVSCTDESYLEQLDTLLEKQNIEELKAEIFKIIRYNAI